MCVEWSVLGCVIRVRLQDYGVSRVRCCCCCFLLLPAVSAVSPRYLLLRQWGQCRDLLARSRLSICQRGLGSAPASKVSAQYLPAQGSAQHLPAARLSTCQHRARLSTCQHRAPLSACRRGIVRSRPAKCTAARRWAPRPPTKPGP